jgi:hypothetical protein
VSAAELQSAGAVAIAETLTDLGDELRQTLDAA